MILETVANQKRTVFIKLKEGVLDPQGETIHKALMQMGYDGFASVRSGRFFELEIEGDPAQIDRQVDEVCSKLLANPVIEKYEIT